MLLRGTRDFTPDHKTEMLLVTPKLRFHTTLAKSWQLPQEDLAPAVRPTEHSGGALHAQR